ncbi:AAEL015423-PA [Aedes aegypti]|uniref:AAEL015423-PA n=1 Tax=Aedes aegypti TaxID=7159 RepID=Q1DGY6_AEDAE|nr:AAEL015423-PA [Aedes aegypti]
MANIKDSSRTRTPANLQDAGASSTADLRDTPALPPATRRKFTPILNRLWKKTVDCGPGWSRRPLAQRQAIAIHRRQAAEEKVRQRMRAARQRRARSRSRSQSRTRTRSRSRQRTSRTRSRSRLSRKRTRSRNGRC